MATLPVNESDLIERFGPHPHYEAAGRLGR